MSCNFDNTHLTGTTHVPPSLDTTREKSVKNCKVSSIFSFLKNSFLDLIGRAPEKNSLKEIELTQLSAEPTTSNVKEIQRESFFSKIRKAVGSLFSFSFISIYSEMDKIPEVVICRKLVKEINQLEELDKKGNLSEIGKEKLQQLKKEKIKNDKSLIKIFYNKSKEQPTIKGDWLASRYQVAKNLPEEGQETMELKTEAFSAYCDYLRPGDDNKIKLRTATLELSKKAYGEKHAKTIKEASKLGMARYSSGHHEYAIKLLKNAFKDAIELKDEKVINYCLRNLNHVLGHSYEAIRSKCIEEAREELLDDINTHVTDEQVRIDFYNLDKFRN